MRCTIWAQNLYMNYIDGGRRGELAAALLIMQAYDAARVVSGRRWVSGQLHGGLNLLLTWEYGPTFDE